MKPGHIASLSLMMLLEYFVWGAWYVTLGTYMDIHLNASGIQIAFAYSALAIATMISPFFVGMVADRLFAAQRIMGVLHLAGAVILVLASTIENNSVFFWVILFYSLLYMPTIALSNNVAFHQMSDPGRQFPWIRVFGTIGWIVAGLMINALGIEGDGFTFIMAAVASAVLGIFSFFLPDTPPKGKVSSGSAIGTEAFILFRDKPYLVFFISAILVCIPLSFYYGFANLFLNQTGMENAASKMTLGQVSEALFILAIPFLFYRLGVKKMILIGISAWVLRYVCFAHGNAADGIWMLYAGIILHGICYDFFFVTGYMYTEKKAAAGIKNAAQGLFTFATYGVGMVIGTVTSGAVVDYFEVADAYQWTNIWYVPAGIATVVLIFFALSFHERREITEAA